MSEDPKATYEAATPHDHSSIEGVVRALRRGGLIVIIVTLLGAGAAFGISKNLPPEYQATAQLYLTPASSSTALFQDPILGQNLARSYVQLATAEVVLRPAMAKVGLHDLKAFRDQTEVIQATNTSVISVSFRDVDPQRAAAAANAIAASFIDQSVGLQSRLQLATADELDRQTAAMQKELADLDAQSASLRVALAGPSTPANAQARAEQQAQLAQVDAARTTKQQTLAQLIRSSSDTRLAAVRGENSMSLWQSAAAPGSPVSPRIAVNTLVGGLAAGLAALLIVGLLAYLDDRITDIDQLRARLRVPALGEVARGKMRRGGPPKLFVRDEPNSVEAEDFRSLRTNISFANIDRRPQTILVTSAQPLEGKSVVSANLALAFAQTGAPTILIDADLRRPSQQKLFNVRADVGLTDLLAGNAPLSALQGARVAPQLILIPSGPLPPNPAELLSSQKMSNLLKQLVEMTEGTIVIIDSSPLLAVTDAAAIAAKVDGCILVVDAERTQVRTAARALEALRAVRATVLGAVVNKVRVPHTAYYYNQEPSREPEVARVTAPEQTVR